MQCEGAVLGPTSKPNMIIAAVLALLCTSAIMIHFYDQFWWPADEGVYAYVAQRANAGDIIHRDIIDLHSGYGNALNALAFRMFGEDLLSLRYPLVVIAFVQSCIAFVLLKDKGAVTAFVGAVALAAFSFVQFPNPSANWHALGVFFCLCLCLEKLPKGAPGRLLLAGFLVGVCFFTRQLSGVFLCLGLACVLLAEAEKSWSNARVSSVLIGGIATLGLLLYVASKQSLFGIFWAGLWPMSIMVVASLRARVSVGEAIKTLGAVLAGFILAGLPLAILAFSHDALMFWINDIFVTALLINSQDFIDEQSYLFVVFGAVKAVLAPSGGVAFVSGLAWLALILSVPLLGAYASLKYFRDRALPPSVILAVFWVVGGLHYQIPIYFYFVLPAALLGGLMLRSTPAILVGLIALSCWALVFQAAQPLSRSYQGLIEGERAAANVPANLPRVSLRVQAEDAALYRDLIETIEATARPSEPLMTVPMEPQINFMTARESPVRYYATPLGLRVDQDVLDTLKSLDAEAPLFVVHRRGDKYLTPLSATLLDEIKVRSEQPMSFGTLDLYRYHGSHDPSTSVVVR